MDSNLADSVNSMARLNSALRSLDGNISQTSLLVEESVNILNESFSKESDLFIPEENHKQLENSLEIICRLPALLLNLESNFNALRMMNLDSIIQKYKKVATDIEETNKKLTEMAKDMENVIDSL